MKKSTKVALGIGCGTLLVIGAIVLVGGYFALNYVERRLDESVGPASAEGRAYGATTDQQGCMDQGMRRSASVEILDLKGAFGLGAFVDSCLETSKPTPNFCDGVPSFWSMNDTQWGMDVCRKKGVDPEKTACIHVTKRKHQFCSKPL